MAKKKRRHKKDTLTKYMLWILVGLRLGYNIIAHKNKRLYQWVKPTGEVDDKMTIDATAVNKLNVWGLVAVNDSKTQFRLTVRGFDVADDKLTRSMKEKSENKENEKNEYSLIDSSLACG